MFKPSRTCSHRCINSEVSIFGASEISLSSILPQWDDGITKGACCRINDALGVPLKTSHDNEPVISLIIWCRCCHLRQNDWLEADPIKSPTQYVCHDQSRWIALQAFMANDLNRNGPSKPKGKKEAFVVPIVYFGIHGNSYIFGLITDNLPYSR